MRIHFRRLVASGGLVVSVSAGLAGEAWAIPSVERAALMALYNSTNGAGWSYRTGWRNVDDTDFNEPGTECSWYGVTCDMDRVSRLDLTGNNLDGPLPPEIDSLTALTRLWLNGNQLFGPIPVGLATLARLEELRLDYNQLSGPIPDQLGSLSALKILGLSHNQLTGGIPTELAQLTNLEGLWLDQNPLGGTIPGELGGLTKLTSLDLGRSLLTGPIPPEIGALTGLSWLVLSENELSGDIPGELWALTSLSTLQLDQNQLTGSIPAAVGNLTLLSELELTGNLLTGTIPPEVGGPPDLSYVKLGDNQLTGSIPPSIASLARLEVLDLEGNQLTGPIPAPFASPRVRMLLLGRNELTGSIPASLGSLSDLMYLVLGSNRLSGSIPPELGNLPELVWLWLSDNELTGPIPSSLGNLTKMQILTLQGNHLSGPIPSSLANLANLWILTLGENQLDGAVPSWLGSLSLLEFLDLRSNQLVGDVPAELRNLPSLYDYGGIDLRWNGLHTSDPALVSFLDQKHPSGGWVGTQTVAPAGVTAGAAGTGSVLLSWTPIAYTADGGGYRVRYGTTAGGPYPNVFGPTASKLLGSTFVTGLTPDTSYHFVVETVTDPHVLNQNTVISEPSAEVSAHTAAGPSLSYVLAVTKEGTGSGRVTSVPAGIDCGSDCSEAVVGDSVVTLTATADQGSLFAGWSGGCTGSDPTCEVVVETADVSVTATFVLPPPTSYYTVEPCRAYDSREASLGGPAPLAAGTETNVMLAGTCGIPPGASAVSLNVTTTQQTWMGHLRLYPRGAVRPNASTLNYVAMQNRANNAIVPLGPSGELTVYVGQAEGTTHVVIDVNGYYAAETFVDRR
jgi:Leucine-rich repeat (LRR) protein